MRTSLALSMRWLLLTPILALAPAARAEAPAAVPAEALPAAPTFAGWTLKSDSVIPAKKVEAISTKLGGKLTALRNAVYEVKGEKVQVNVMVAASAADADTLFASLTAKKPAWSCVRKGTTLYELVGKNSAMDAMKKAHDQLAAP